MSPLWEKFVGGAYASRSPTLDCEALFNRFATQLESQTNGKTAALMPTPGLRSLLNVSTTSCRGLWSEDGRTFGVIGTNIYEFDLVSNGATLLGTLSDDGEPASSASNGRGGEQRMFVGGGELKVFDYHTNTLSSAISLPLTNAPVQCAFLDGYGLLLEADTVRVWFSALEDFESWDGLDWFARSQTSDNLRAMTVLRDRVWCFGSQTTEIYFDSGDADVPFVPYPGSIMREGIVGPWAWAIEGEAVYWLSEDDQGRARMVRAAEANAQKVSTDAIDFAIAQYPRLDNTEAVAYAQEGHSFVAWTMPTAETCGVTWCLNTQDGLWHRRAGYDPNTGEWFRWRVRGLCSTPYGLIVGDYETGDLYELDLDTYTENGALIRRLRRAPYLSSENQWLFLDQFELGVQSGVGNATAPGVAPIVNMRLSRDGGQTWTNTVSAALGAQGQYQTRAVWRRLGRSRSDRLVIEVSDMTPNPVIIGPGAWLRTSQGTGAL